jgi:ribonuclease HI
MHYLFLNGASHGNIGVTGVGGSLSAPGGIQVVTYAWGIGITTNNIVEAYYIYEGLRMAKENKIS